MPQRTALSKKSWKHAGRKKVELRSGAGTVYQVPGTLLQAIRGKRVPNPLLEVAIRVETVGITPEDIKSFDADQHREYWDFQDWFIADTLNAAYERPWLEGEWIKPEDVAELPPEDRTQLWLNAIHQFDDRIQEALAKLDDLRSFRGRGQNGSLAAVPDGDGVREATE